MELSELIRSPGEWLRGDGDRDGIVVSSRVRLARNLAHHHFIARLDETGRKSVAEQVSAAIGSGTSGRELTYFDLEKLSPLDRRLLVERHLISREAEEADGARGVAINLSESLSIMVNEEDHIRLQALRSGLRIEEAYAMVDRLDDELANALDLAFSPDQGFLTACPTNLGTGMRVSVMLHLPGLVMSRHLEKAFRAVHDLRLAVRGFYGEGTEAHGEFYQISNQITLGRTEAEIIADLRAVIEGLVAYERKARDKLLEISRVKLEDRVWRAYATLRHARLLNSEEAMKHLSSVRLGASLEMIPGLAVPFLNAIFIYSQPAHLQRLEGRELPAEERDEVRATYIRQRLEEAERKG